MSDRMEALRGRIANNTGATEEDKARRAEDKSKLRQIEALEMMEEYREVSEAYSKMSKASRSKAEEIFGDTLDITKAGLTLAGEIGLMTGIGAGVGAGLLGAAGVISISQGAYSLGKTVGGAVVGQIKDISGHNDNKATKREDMAIAMIEKMQEIGSSKVFKEGNQGFWDYDNLMDRSKVPEGVLLRQGKNVRHMRNVLRRGLDADMPALIQSKSKNELKENLAKSFGQDD